MTFIYLTLREWPVQGIAGLWLVQKFGHEASPRQGNMAVPPNPFPLWPPSNPN